MSEANEQYAYFTIAGDFDPDEITRAVGVTPTSSWRKGDLHPRTRTERKFSRWALESRIPRKEPLEAHIADVIAQLDQQSESFALVSRERGGCMQLVSYFHEAYPGLHFDRALVDALARYSLTVDFDFYYLWSDAREDA